VHSAARPHHVKKLCASPSPMGPIAYGRAAAARFKWDTVIFRALRNPTPVCIGFPLARAARDQLVAPR